MIRLERELDNEKCAALMEAAPEMLEALETVKQFILNGIELEYICMPDDGDSANETLRIIDEAIRKARGNGNA